MTISDAVIEVVLSVLENTVEVTVTETLMSVFVVAGIFVLVSLKSIYLAKRQTDVPFKVVDCAGDD